MKKKIDVKKTTKDMMFLCSSVAIYVGAAYLRGKLKEKVGI